MATIQGDRSLSIFHYRTRVSAGHSVEPDILSEKALAFGARSKARRQNRQDDGFNGELARELLDSIDTSTVVGLRDRAPISVMTFAFARIGASVGMRVELTIPRASAGGSVCIRKAASVTRCRRITLLKPTSMPTSRRPA
jgi:hypothetical protein